MSSANYSKTTYLLHPCVGFCKSSEVLAFIHKFVPLARLTEEIGMEMTFILPASKNYTNAFRQLFEELDRESDNLHIHKYGISDTTMEEVNNLYHASHMH